MSSDAVSDKRTSLHDVKEKVRMFCDNREWDVFHGPKDVAIGMVTEAAELLGHFRFRGEEECSQLLSDPAKRSAIEEELADVLFFLLRFSQRFGMDLSCALDRKLAKNANRYPIDKARGRNLKYTEL
jgi:NTP pyrophosphatase (non-canonical NTP hydrolase)